jgi:defect in organelle trafficking protein DotD
LLDVTTIALETALMKPWETLSCQKTMRRRTSAHRLPMVSTILLAGLLVGCAHHEPPPQSIMVSDPIGDRLATAANEAAQALQKLSRVEQQRTPATPAAVDVTKLPDELKIAISLNWNGPVEEALKRLAREIGFGFCAAPANEVRCLTSVGRRPSSPIIVVLDGTSQPTYQLLQDIALQLQSRAKLEVDVINRRMELRYEQR